MRHPCPCSCPRSASFCLPSCLPTSPRRAAARLPTRDPPPPRDCASHPLLFLQGLADWLPIKNVRTLVPQIRTVEGEHCWLAWLAAAPFCLLAGSSLLAAARYKVSFCWGLRSCSGGASIGMMGAFAGTSLHCCCARRCGCALNPAAAPSLHPSTRPQCK